MRRLATILLSAFTALLLSGAIPALAPTANAWWPWSCPGEVRHEGVDGAVLYSTQTRQEYLRDDFRLGPLFLPWWGQVGRLVWGYDRLGYGFRHMTANDFLECYWQPTFTIGTKITGVEGWKFPPDHGFAGTHPAKPVTPGIRLQLFGFLDPPHGIGGRFLAPEGTLYRQTAIPPNNLDTVDPNYPFNYHVLFVCKPFMAEQGDIAPWFQQPGGGFQYWTGDNATAADLVNNGSLVDVTLGPKACP